MEVKIKKINILAVLDFWTKKEKLHKKDKDGSKE